MQNQAAEANYPSLKSTLYFAAMLTPIIGHKFGPGEHGDFPSKSMSKDGTVMYLVFSGDDNFCIRKATLEIG
jgi:hypothetical protein